MLYENTGVNELAEKASVSKKTLTIKAPRTKIIPFTSKEKRFHLYEIRVSSNRSKKKAIVVSKLWAEISNFLYLSQKKRASEDGEYLHGWTGFNTNVYKEVMMSSTIDYLPVIDAPRQRHVNG